MHGATVGCAARTDPVPDCCGRVMNPEPDATAPMVRTAHPTIGLQSAAVGCVARTGEARFLRMCYSTAAAVRMAHPTEAIETILESRGALSAIRLCAR